MGARDFPYPHRYAEPLGRLRLNLAEVPRPLAVAGLWLPYSRDLSREAAHLVDHFPPSRGRVDRLAYAPDDWETTVAEVYTRHGRLKAGLLPGEQHRGVVVLRLAGTSVLRLRVSWAGTPWSGANTL